MGDVARLEWGGSGRDRGAGAGHTGGGDPPGGDNMDARVRALEEQMPAINGKLDLILERIDSLRETSATKAELAVLRAEMATKDEVSSIKASIVVLASKDELNAMTRASAKDIQDVAISLHKSVGDKSDGLHRTLNEQTWKFIAVSISFAGLFAGIAFALARHSA